MALLALSQGALNRMLGWQDGPRASTSWVVKIDIHPFPKGDLFWWIWVDYGRLPYWANFAFGGNMILRGYHSTKLCQGVQLILFRWAGKLSYQGCSARGSLRQCCMLGCWEIVGASYTRWGGASWSRAWSCHSEQLEKKTEGKTPKVLASWTLKGKKRNSKDKTYPQSSSVKKTCQR